jgi:hypothetical protein
VHERRSLGGGAPPTALSRALHFLSRDYEPRAFAWELVEVARKITITGFLALVDPGSLLQLYVGVGVALCILILQLYATPYRSLSDNFLSMLSASALMLTLLGSLGIQLTELTPDLSLLGLAQAGLSKDGGSFGFIIFVLIGAALVVLLVAVGMFASSLNQSRSQPMARLASDGTVAVPPILPSGRWHAFVSHQWGSGQDQARGIKAGLTQLVPGLRVFLDVDDLTDIGSLEGLIGATDVILIFLAGSIAADGTERSDYMRSANCIREFRTAVQLRKPIVFVRETDPQHGAISLEAHLRDCPDDELRAALTAAVAADGVVVPWYRVRAYMLVSLRLILERVLAAELRVPGEEPAPLFLSPLEPGAFHLYVPPSGGNGAAGVAALLVEEASRLGCELRATSVAEERPRAHAFLLHLHRQTFSQPQAAALEAEVAAALSEGMQLLLVHEQRNDHGACSFGEIIAQTPRPLLASNVYADLAVPLYEGAHQRVSLGTMLHSATSGLARRELARCNPLRERFLLWQCIRGRSLGLLRRRGWQGKAEDNPALLTIEMSDLGTAPSRRGA